MKLEAKNITKKFPRKLKSSNFFYALSETSLALFGGKLTVVYGRSGSGKTTLLNILSGLLAPSEGQVFLDNTDLYALSDSELSKLRNKNISVIPQGASAVYTLTVLENVLLPLMLYDKTSDEDAARATELLEKLGIAELKDEMPAALSGGELRRMAIARALITDPAFIFADEPTGDLDDENTALVLTLLKETAQNGASVLLISHENEAKSYADVTYRMDAGALTEESC